MKYRLILQDNVGLNTPNRFTLQRWVSEALNERVDKAELCIRIVDKQEIQELNSKYRGKPKSTNVLAFPSDLPEEIKQVSHLIGDIIICSDVVEEEAKQQGKDLQAHWAHMVVHGTLHLIGYDHVEDKDAKVMEQCEIDVLNKLGFPNPYAEQSS